MPSSLPFAILAPVPLEHLNSGLDTERAAGEVAFGTRKWELLRKVDELRGGLPVAVLIYPSHEDEESKLTYKVGWFGWYTHHVDSKNGAHPDGMRFRPQSTAAYDTDNKGHWASFWHVTGLRQLPSNLARPIGKLQGFAGGWRKNAPPRGPELVALPDDFAVLE